MSGRVAFLVFGCRLNQAEAAAWQRELTARGWEESPPESADLVCVHSCAVTDAAQQEVRRTLRRLRRVAPKASVLLSGCAADLMPEGLADLRVPHARKDAWLTEVERAFGGTAAPTPLPASPVRHRTRASLIVQDGCDRFCAYCIVPHLRGAPVSAPMAEALDRARRLTDEGYTEIVLTGCHLALYRDPATGANLVNLLERLCGLPGTARYRLGSVEPCTLDDRALIRLIAGSGGRVCDFLHLPIQTASDTLLKRMGRTYTEAEIRSLLETALTELPLCGLGSDWIVGLPGETETDAEATRRLASDYPFTGAHIFPYSPRPGTPAADFPDRVPGHTQRARAEALRAAADATRAAALRRYLGQRLTVIPERRAEAGWEGWSAQRIRCVLPGEAHRGEPVSFVPTAVSDGRLI